MKLVCFERREDRGAAADQGSEDLPAHDSPRSISLRLASPAFVAPGALRLGAVLPTGDHQGATVDLNRALALKLTIDDVGAPEAEADSQIPSDMLLFLRHGKRGLQRARSVLSWVGDALQSWEAPDLLAAEIVLSRREVWHRAPVPAPGKLVGVARNYAAHADEVGQPRPEEPVLFLKAPTAVIGPSQEIVLPRVSQQVDYEGELAVVIGSTAHNVGEADALDYVAGYTVANDVSARDFQNTRGQHFIGKSCDSFAPLGPVLVTTDEIEDPQELDLRTAVSGETRQKARTSEMIFPVRKLIAFASQLMTLKPGDVLLTGTPAGVGAAADPPRWLRDGDVVDVEIQGIGLLRNYVRREGIGE